MSNTVDLPEAALPQTSQPAYIRAKILHVLSIYPILSPSALQVNIGPYTPANLWRPILRELISEGLICQDEISNEAPDGKWRASVRLYLTINQPIANSLIKT